MKPAVSSVYLSSMPIYYQIDSDRRRAYIVASTVITGAEVLAAQARLAADPQFEPTFAQLFDLTETREANISAEEIRTMSEGTAFTVGARRALVVKEKHVLGLTRMFQIITDSRGGDIEIFADRAAAERWLDAGFGSPDPRPDDATAAGEAGGQAS